MKAAHRKILREVMFLTNQIGSTLDGTATHESKYRDRQQAHMLVSKILYAILADHPENDNKEMDFDDAQTALNALRKLPNKDYPDRTGTYLITTARLNGKKNENNSI